MADSASSSNDPFAGLNNIMNSSASNDTGGTARDKAISARLANVAQQTPGGADDIGNTITSSFGNVARDVFGNKELFTSGNDSSSSSQASSSDDSATSSGTSNSQSNSSETDTSSSSSVSSASSEQSKSVSQSSSSSSQTSSTTQKESSVASSSVSQSYASSQASATHSANLSAFDLGSLNDEFDYDPLFYVNDAHNAIGNYASMVVSDCKNHKQNDATEVKKRVQRLRSAQQSWENAFGEVVRQFSHDISQLQDQVKVVHTDQENDDKIDSQAEMHILLQWAKTGVPLKLEREYQDLTTIIQDPRFQSFLQEANERNKDINGSAGVSLVGTPGQQSYIREESSAVKSFASSEAATSAKSGSTKGSN